MNRFSNKLKRGFHGLVLSCLCGMGLSAFAASGTAIFQNGTKQNEVSYVNATKVSTVGNDLVLEFTTATSSGSFTLTESATANILVVGGGAAGTAAKNKNSAGSGGGGGKGSYSSSVSLPVATYTVTVGAGGSSSGKSGGASSLSATGFKTISGAGGSGTNGGWNHSDSITGSSITYGANGAAGGSSTATPGTYGGGGQGGKKSNNDNQGGAGAAGAVIVRITAMVPPKDRITGVAQTLYAGNTKTLPNECVSSAWTATSSQPAYATVSASGAAGEPVVISGLQKGSTTVTVENETEIWTYAVTVKEKERVDRDPITLYVGEETTITEVSGATQDWDSMNKGIVEVVSSEGASATIKGVKAGNTTVWVSDDTHEYTYEVNVVEKTIHEMPLSFISMDKDETFTVTPEEDWKNATCSNTGVATISASSGAAGTPLVLTPQPDQEDGLAILSYETATDKYVYPVGVLYPHRVHFCAGDKVQIWYHNTNPKKWWIYVNGVKYDTNVLATGDVMSVTLNAAQDPGVDTDIIATAERAASDEVADLIVISDEENFYAYRMSVEGPRTLRLGQTATMECATVAVNTWRTSVDEKYSASISATCTNTETPNHRTTVTLMAGQVPAEETYVEVNDALYHQEEVNAQGAIYTLKTRVVGLQTVQVYMSPGTAIDVGWHYFDGTDDTAYTYAADEAIIADAPTKWEDLSRVGYQNVNEAISFAFASEGAVGPGFEAHIEVPAEAALGDYYAYTVKAGEDEVVTYLIVATSAFSLPLEFNAPGVLYGQRTPWIVRSSDEVGLEARNALSGNLYTASITGHRIGDYSVTATNSTVSAGYWVIKARIYEAQECFVEMPANGETNVVLSTRVGGWSLASAGGHTTAKLDDPSQSTVHLEITSGAVEGLDTYTVSSPYCVVTVHVFVGNTTKPKIYVPEVQHVTVGTTGTLPLDCVAYDWVAHSEDNTLVSVPTKGTMGETVKIGGQSIGETQVVVENDQAIYIYRVSVDLSEAELPPQTIGIGETYTNLFEGVIADAVSVSTLDHLIADVVMENGRYIVKGLQDGQTKIRVTTPEMVYLQDFTVHERHIEKRVTLALGNTSTSSYSFTFDDVLSISNMSPDRVEVVQEGNTLTFIPKVIGSCQVYVDCKVDGLTQSSTLHYYFTINQLPDSDLEIVNFDQGYIAYKNAADVYRDGGDLVLVFTNTLETGVFTVPDSYTAKMDILAVGGGGGGGSPVALGTGGGGGGAGGFNYVQDRYLTGGSFGVNVGAGGPASSGRTGQPTAGMTGAPSFVTNQFAHIYAMANGGGGGAAPAEIIYEGMPGGSGGGGAWLARQAGDGGRGTDGEGTDGGTPTTFNAGAGGGGAGGAGGADGTGGVGRTSDLTGTETLYSVGGAGGRADTLEPAVAVTGPGFGGAGGNSGVGTAGSDGVVVVRVSALYQNVLVPLPDDMMTTRFEWTDGGDFTPFDYAGIYFRSISNAHPYEWKDVIDHITGTTNVVCSYGGEGGTNMVGVGYYNFTIWLKDGFAWEDKEDPDYGSVRGQRYMWTVVEDLKNIDATIEVHKSVEWIDASNAVVKIEGISSPEMSGQSELNVLFLGTLCSNHGIDPDVVGTSLNTVASKANVDYFLYENSTLDYSGSLLKGQTLTRSIEVPSGGGNHKSLGAFYERLHTEFVVNKRQYDYIVFEFDGSRLALDYVTNIELEKEIAKILAPYYASSNVILIVDNNEKLNGTSVYPNEVWADDYWRVNTYACRTSTQDYHLTSDEYCGLVGMFDPALYLSATARTQEEMSVESVEATRTESSRSVTMNYYAGNRYDLQVMYDDADKVATVLDDAIRVKPYNLMLRDKIVSPEEGLSILGVTTWACTNEVDGAASKDEADWFEVVMWDAATGTSTFNEAARAYGINGASLGVDLDSNLVTGCLSNIATKVFTRFKTHVLDNGTFCTSEGAVYNQKTGLYEKNPNEGAANLDMVDEDGKSLGVQGEAEAEILWTYSAYPITAHVTGGEIYINSMMANPLAMIAGSRVPVFYRGRGGYKLTNIIIDGVERPLTDDILFSYVFDNLDKAHEISVIYEPYFGGIESVAVTNLYDGAPHIFPVKLDDKWDPAFKTEIRYALSPDATEAEYMTEDEFLAYYANPETECLANVGEYTYYYRVFAEQPGYGYSFADPGWVWVDTGVQGSDTVTILPAPLVVRPDYIHLEYNTDDFPSDATWIVTGFTNNETIAVLGDVPTSWSVGSDYKKGDPVGQYPTWMVGVSDGDIVGNYEMEVRPNFLDVEKTAIVIDEIPQGDQSVLDPEDPFTDTGVDRVIKEYDGVPTNLTVTITFGPNETREDYVIHYRLGDDGEWTDENPSPVHVGTNRVWYAVEDVGGNHFAVTNYQYIIITPRPVTLVSGSASKVYDGEPLCNDDVFVAHSSKPFVTGDEPKIEMTASRTEVGTEQNTFMHTFKDEITAADYIVTHEYGTLTVTPAAIEINGVDQPSDPNFPLPQGENGVDSILTYYTGESTNLTVVVTSPGADQCVIRYSTNRVDWVEENPTFTDVGNYTVYYSVESSNYAPVTNFSFVAIKPREITVWAENSGKMPGVAEDPELTYTIATDHYEPKVSDEFWRAALSELEEALTISREPGEARGEYPITVAGPTQLMNGKVKVIYIPAVFTISGDLTISKLWITDHADAGGGKIYLAFKPTMNLKLTAEFVRKLSEMGRIKAGYTTKVDEIDTAPLKTVPLRDSTGALDVDKGWIWILVDPTEEKTRPLYWKVFVDQADMQ